LKTRLYDKTAHFKLSDKARVKVILYFMGGASFAGKVNQQLYL